MNATAAERDAQLRAAGLQITASVLSLQRRAEEELLRTKEALERTAIELAGKNAELEAKNAELERFTYTVSHDLKSPLVTIGGFLGLAEADARAGRADALFDDLGEIRRAAERMRRLLDDLLALSRIGRVVNPPQPVPLADLVRDVLELLAGAIRERGVRVEVADDLPVLFGDRVRLTEVVQNLIDNAVKYMGPQPAPVVRVEAVRRDGRDGCAVRDNGLGLDPRYHEKVFGLFEQVDRGAGGTGIGLALVKRIVEAHGGRVWVESAGVGCGSAFCFAVPSPHEEDR